MRTTLVLGIVFLLLVTVPAVIERPIPRSTEIYLPPPEPIPIVRDWYANIIVVGYNPTMIDEPILLQGLPTVRYYATDTAEITYTINYNIYYADNSYFDELRQVMQDNSKNGTSTGTRLDETALSYQKNNPDEPQRIFFPRDGRVIDGYAVEDWLEENPFVLPPNPGYTLYLVNFSTFDSADHSLEHWYDYHPVDPDTGEEQDWFRLEWDNALNPNVTMDHPFFGGRYNSYIIDPSAHQWYLKWCRIWWSENIGTEYDFWTQDLEDKVGTLNLTIPVDVDALNVYLRECIWDPITQLFFPYQHQPASYVSTGTLKSLVFCMDVANGTSIESLEWITNSEMQKSHLEELYPFIDWTVDIDYYDIDKEPLWNSLFWTYAAIEPDGTTVVNGTDMFYAIYNSMKPAYVVEDGNITVFGVVFIKKQMEMHAYNGTFTGLGGDGQTVIWKSWERYYRSDGVTPKDGISSVQLHETMHAIGFHHSWQHEHYSSDFSWGPMGYFAYHNGTSTFDKNWVQSTYLDQMEGGLWEEFLNRPLTTEDRPETEFAEQHVSNAFEIAQVCYNEMDWRGTYDALLVAKDWIRRYLFSISDLVPPVIHAWGTIPEEVESEEFLCWTYVTDDFSGIENVTLYIQADEGAIKAFPMSFNGNNWTVIAQVPSHTSNLTIWIEAWDWGMNVARRNILAQVQNPPDWLFPLVIAATTACIVIALGVYAMKRKE